MQRFCPGFFTGFLCALLAIAPAYAQNNTTSSAEEVGMAFFKTGGTNPDFTKLAKGTRDYRLAPLARREVYLDKEKQRLIKQYAAYDANSRMLRVITYPMVDLITTPQKDADPIYSMKISFNQNDDVLFFPYQYQDYNIALLPQQLNELLQQPIPELQYNLLKAAFDDKLQGRVRLYIELKPVKAYMDQPYDIGGKEQWALLTNVAGLAMTSQKNAPLWNYSAPWYVSPVTNDLRDIYSEKTEAKQREQDLENPLRPVQ